MTARTDRLLEWLKQNGAKFPKVEIRESQTGGRGLFAAANLREREVAIELPAKVILTTQKVNESPLGLRIGHAKLPFRTNDAILATFLLDEKHRPGAFWQPYVESMPGEFPSMPFNYVADDLKWLEGTSALMSIEEKQQAIEHDYKLLAEHFPDVVSFSLEEFRWAHAAALSRRGSIRVRGAEEEALLPYYDMTNHRVPPNTNWTSVPERHLIQAQAVESIRRGQELFLFYGHKSVLVNLMTYGFIDEGNTWDVTTLLIGVPDDVAESALKRKMITGREDITAPFRFDVSEPRTPRERFTHAQLYSFLRFAQATGKELQLLTTLGIKPGDVAPFSIANELRALKMLETVCEKTLAQYPTTQEEDEALLKQGGITFIQRQCVLVRRSEKRILKHTIGFVREMAAAIQKDPDSFRNHIRERFLSNTQLKPFWPMVEAGLQAERGLSMLP